MTLPPELEAYFNSMNAFAQRKFVDTAREFAKAWPAEKHAGLLRLVDSTTPPQLLPRELDRDVNRPAIILVRKAVDL